jgi:signal transduction histidine kinase
MGKIFAAAILAGALLGAAPAATTGPPPAATPGPAPAGPKRVLILDSFGRDFAPYSAVVSTFRTELAQRSEAPIEFLEVSLETVRSDVTEEAPVVDYVRALCARRKIDLVVPNGDPAARFWLRYRDSLLPDTPSLIAVVEERYVNQLSLSPDDSAVAIRVDLPGLLRHILQVLPGTKNVVVILGSSPLEKFWLSDLRRDWRPLEGQVRVTFLSDMPFEEMLRRTADLPPRSAIFFALMLVDAAGVPHEQETAADRLHATANAPMFGWSDNLLGHGIVGGPLIPLATLGREAAVAAQKVLAGERPGAAGGSVTVAGRPVYDWRELQRWGIDESRLDPAREILFRPPSLFQAYRWPIFMSLIIIAAQAIAIAGLLVARRSRQQAEEESSRLRRELAHAGRVSIVGQLASSLAHELNQPLGAILRNAEAADLFLDASPPNLDEVRAILADIRKDDQRAGSVIDGIRTLIRRQSTDLKAVGVAAIVDAVVALALPDAKSRRVALSIDLDPDLPAVRGNQVQLQQVLINLMLNGMEAMESSPEGGRALTVRARRLDAGQVEMAVGDSGPGIPPGDLPRIFDNFYTTKPGGMGMGLSICRRIVEAHGGRIVAENDAGGAVLRVTLPVADGGP